MRLVTNYKSGKSIAKQIGTANHEETLKSKRCERLRLSTQKAGQFEVRKKQSELKRLPIFIVRIGRARSSHKKPTIIEQVSDTEAFWAILLHHKID
tara:strand:- start:71 stop:358 length:288 start_codon:yes stop_codon:yes gene_type:complete